MSSVSTALWSTLCEQLFPSTTYHYNSGGDPAHIPDLSYEQLKAFYRSHYHPSNAIFMTFGDIPAGEHQAVFESSRVGSIRETGPADQGAGRAALTRADADSKRLMPTTRKALQTGRPIL